MVGAALGFGAQQMVRDLLAGFFIILEKQYGFGDLVTLTVVSATDATGTVENVTLRVTRLRSSDGELLTIPNGQIVKTVNLSKDWARAVVDIPVQASADLGMINDTLREVCEHALDDKLLGELLLDAPTVMGVESIEVDVVTLRLVARTLPGKQFEAGRRLRALVVRALARAGVDTPSEAPVTVGAIAASADVEVLEAVNVALPGGQLLVPDVVVVAAEAVGEMTIRLPYEAVLAVVEVVSPSTVSIDRAKVEAWIKKGAQPSNTVRRLIANAPNTPIASAPDKK